MDLDNKTISYFKGKNETKVDIDLIRTELAQFLQMDNLNFLIGAGCSSHLVDNNEMGIPGMAKLYEDFFKNIQILKLLKKMCNLNLTVI